MVSCPLLRLQTPLLYHRGHLGAKRMRALIIMQLTIGAESCQAADRARPMRRFAVCVSLQDVVGERCAMDSVGVGAETWAFSCPPSRPGRYYSRSQGDTS